MPSPSATGHAAPTACCCAARRRSLCSVASRTGVLTTHRTGARPRRDPLVRVLGVDPGLTRCGLGVVDGRPGARHDGGRRRRAHAERRRPGRAAGLPRARARRLAGPLRARGRRGRAGLRRHQHHTVMAHGPGDRRRPAHGDRARHARRLPHADRGQGGRHRLAAAPTRPRSRRWSPGILGLEVAPEPADAADALALAICHVWRGGPDRRGSSALGRGRCAGDRLGARPGRPRRPRPRRRRGRRRRHARAHDARHRLGVPARRARPRSRPRSSSARTR